MPVTWLLPAIVALLGADALEAWQLGPIPIQWLSRFGAIALAAWFLVTGRLHFAPGSGWLLLLLTWTGLVGAASAAFGQERVMPPLATTTYPVFIALRVMNLLAFLGMMALTYTVLVQGRERQLQRALVTLGAVVAIIAVYLYAAQVFGLPQPARNRIGTGGEEQGLTFTYAFHRALGTFREPSHLAEWLALPMFLSFAAHTKRQYMQGVVIAAALLLTGSLTGIVGAGVGLVVALIITNPLSTEKLKLLGRIAIVGALALIVFQEVVASNLPGSVSLYDVLFGRLAPILEGGLGASNRDYIYTFVGSVPIPPLGFGIGNANLELSRYFGSELVVSFLSLYFTMAYSLGIPGLLLVGGLLVAPIGRLWMFASTRLHDRIVYLAVAGYCAWLVVFGVRADEFPPMFAVVYALVAYFGRPVGRTGAGTLAA